MPLLGDIYSYIDALKRKAADTVSNPVNSLNQFIGNIGDQQNQNNALMNQSGFGLLGKPTVSVLAPQQGPSIGYGNQTAVTPQQQALARGLLADQGANSAMAAATVWHGSPHKFDKFDSSKIGTGEGAQAYGHGLYLAETEDVARRYRDTLTNFRPDHIEAKLIESGVSPEMANTYAQFAAQKQGGARAFGDFQKSLAEKSPSPYIEQFREKLRAEMPKTQAALDNVSGSLYKVDLPDEHIAKMLDWDKPLSEQPQAFKDAVSQREHQRMMPILEQRRATLAGLPDGAENASILKKQIAILEDEITQPQAVPNMTGGEYFNYLRNREMAPAEQADWLRNAGIPGIRYLDGGSRGAGQGSSNFVVFPGNEGLLNIMERNGQPVNQLSGLLVP